MPFDDYLFARDKYADLNVDAEAALRRLGSIPLSMHCWQGDDVGGFEKTGTELGGGLAVTGNYPGKARTLDELRGDLDQAFALIPGKHRLNLHACYADLGGQERRAQRLHRRAIPELDRLVRASAGSGWISTRPFSPIRSPTTA